MFRVSSHPGSSSKWEHLLNSSCLYVCGIFLHVSHSIIRANRRLPPSFVCRICVHLCASPSLHCHYMTTESTGNPISAVWGTFKYRFPFFTSPNSVLSSSVCLFVCVCGFCFCIQRNNEHGAASAQHSWAQPPPGWELPDLLPVLAGDAAVQTPKPWQGTVLWLFALKHKEKSVHELGTAGLLCSMDKCGILFLVISRSG